MNHYEQAILELREARAAFRAGKLSREELTAVAFANDVEFKKAGQWIKLDREGAKDFLLREDAAPSA